MQIPAERDIDLSVLTAYLLRKMLIYFKQLEFIAILYLSYRDRKRVSNLLVTYSHSFFLFWLTNDKTRLRSPGEK